MGQRSMYGGPTKSKSNLSCTMPNISARFFSFAIVFVLVHVGCRRRLPSAMTLSHGPSHLCRRNTSFFVTPPSTSSAIFIFVLFFSAITSRSIFSGDMGHVSRQLTTRTHGQSTHIHIVANNTYENAVGANADTYLKRQTLSDAPSLTPSTAIAFSHLRFRALYAYEINVFVLVCCNWNCSTRRKKYASLHKSNAIRMASRPYTSTWAQCDSDDTTRPHARHTHDTDSFVISAQSYDIKNKRLHFTKNLYHLDVVSYHYRHCRWLGGYELNKRLRAQRIQLAVGSFPLHIHFPSEALHRPMWVRIVQSSSKIATN